MAPCESAPHTPRLRDAATFAAIPKPLVNPTAARFGTDRHVQPCSSCRRCGRWVLCGLKWFFDGLAIFLP